MSITIYSSGGTLKYTLPAIQTSRLHQSLNGECLFDFTMPGRKISSIAIGDQVRLGDLWFYVCRIGKQTLTAGAEYSVSCEHVSYSLADMEQDAAHFSGTPAAGLATILAGTGFSAGTVTVSGEWSITINQATNKRTALQQWAAECGAEISYSGMSINFLSRVGSSVPVLLSDAENVKSLSVTLDSRSSTQTYAVELSRIQTVSLGDAVKIRYSSLDLDVSTRIISLDYDPFHPWLISMTTGDYVPNFTGAVSAALEARLKEGQPYYGVTIDKVNGIEIKRSDGLSEALFNSDVFSMRALIDGVMKDRIYFDPIKGDYVFDGALGAAAVFTDSLYAEQGDIAELTVDRLSTSRRVRKYLLGDTSDDNYILIQDKFVRFITATPTGLYIRLITENEVNLITEAGDYMDAEAQGSSSFEQAKNRHGQFLYWEQDISQATIDSEGYPFVNGRQVYITTTNTGYPVYVYQYSELTKAEYSFILSGDTYVPVQVWGAGSGYSDYGKGFIQKLADRFTLIYKTRSGTTETIDFNDDGWIDVNSLRKPLQFDFSNIDSGTFTETIDGNYTFEYTVGFDRQGRITSIRDGAGHLTEVIW